MKNRADGSPAPWYRPFLARRCPCFWGNGHPHFCLMFQWMRLRDLADDYRLRRKP